jgi:ribosomal protein S18 acetylase RimI-like enzyme
MSMDDTTIDIAPLEPATQLDELRPLWLALRDHHGSVTPDWEPLRAADDSWARRRADYEKWLTEPDAFCLVARQGRRAVGYVLVTVNEGSPTWQRGRFGYVETLSVLPDARGRSIGAALLDAAAQRLAALGVDDMELTVVARNERARRFYAREGFEEAFVTVRRTRTR